MSDASRAPARPFGRLALLGFVVASAGGPIALFALYLGPTAAVPRPLLLLTVALGLAVALASIAAWRGFSAGVNDRGGQYAFVRRTWGERAGRIQGWIWIVAYLLYLPYTVTYIVTYLLPRLWQIPTATADVLTLALPVGLGLLVLYAPRAAVGAVAAFGALQALAILVLGMLALRAGAVAPTVAALPGLATAGSVGVGALAVSSLFVCMSLVVFLGGEARPGDVRWSLGAGYGVVAVLALIATLALVLGARTLSAPTAGIALVEVEATTAWADVVGLLVMASTAALIVAEFIALSRLGQAMLGLGERQATGAIAVFFVAANLISLWNPWRFYTLTLTPSLIALYVSQAIVFAAYPWFDRARGGRPALAWLIAVVAGGAALFSLYGAFSGLFGT